MTKKSSAGTVFEELVAIMARLRAPDGCPWDREQTYQSIAPHTLEETYEVIDAIERNDLAALREELGDLLLQVVFYAQIAAEEEYFTIKDVIRDICDKLIHRHPHVFGKTTVADSDEVLRNWEHLKKSEGKKSLLAGLPRALPSLQRASRLGEKTSRVGFDWPNAAGVLEKVREELAELMAEPPEARDRVEHEFGDLLFSVAQAARFMKVDPESALRRACDRFTERFNEMEAAASRNNWDLQKLTVQEWEQLWQAAKTAQNA